MSSFTIEYSNMATEQNGIVTDWFSESFDSLEDAQLRFMVLVQEFLHSPNKRNEEPKIDLIDNVDNVVIACFDFQW